MKYKKPAAVLACAPLAAFLFVACQHGGGVEHVPEHFTHTPVAITSASTSAPAAPTTRPSYVQKLREMKPAKACVLSNTAPLVQAKAGAKVFEGPEPHCQGEDMFCDSVEHAPKGTDACFVSNDNLRKAAQKANASGGKIEKKQEHWDALSKVKYFDRIDAHLRLSTKEQEILASNGFVVLDRLVYADYANAFHDIFQEELPLYVGADPILHAVYRATETVLGKIEQKRLTPALKRMLGKLQKGLATSKARLDEQTAKDLDLYLAIAIKLAGISPPDGTAISLFGQDAAVQQIIDGIDEHSLKPVEIFGRSRMIDFSQYEPRGHYTRVSFEWDADSYFKAMTWLSRFEWNLVSRGSRSSHPDASPDPSETPREAKDALALAQLFQSENALAELAQFEEVYNSFAGSREDVSMTDLLKLMDKGHFTAADAAAPEKLKIAIGGDFKRKTRVHFMPEGAYELPVITTVFGPRIAPDTLPLQRLVHDKVPGRYELGAADVGYLLGHDRASHYLSGDLQQHKNLKTALDTARAELSEQANAGKDAQSSFLAAIVALSKPAQGVLPSLYEKDAYLDFRLSSALVGYAQLRHTFVLLSGQGYDAYGCAIPDAYVEPLAPFYAALIKHVEGLKKLAGGGFDGLLRGLRTLSTITKTELTNGGPTKNQAEWLGMVAEFIPKGGFSGDSDEPPKWTGWYFDMFEDREIGASLSTDVVADYFTLTNANKIAYLGTDGPRLGVFIVDSGGAPRALVGPVAHGYEIKTPIEKRLTDADARSSLTKTAPFRESFAVAALKEPNLGLAGQLFECTTDGKLEQRLVLASDHNLGPITVTLLDHHGDPLAPPLTQIVDSGLVVFPFFFPEMSRTSTATDQGRHLGSLGLERHVRTSPVEALSVRVEDLSIAGLGKGPYHYLTSPSVFFGKDFNENPLPTRPRGTEPFFLGINDASEAPYHPPALPDPSTNAEAY